ncbi:MAG: Asp23/Gls24 family envelope stress response protein [Anaerolineales bacterium]|nr:Asp23/Gls24 family envelope stress response protein [Anaerolineales bacterium]
MADSMQPSSDEPVGTTTIAPGVLFTIARLTALGVPGVVALAPVPGVGRVMRRGGNVGALLEVRDQRVSVELHLILAANTSVRSVCRAVQAEVAEAIERMVGMPVERVDVHVQDIDFSTPPS